MRIVTASDSMGLQDVLDDPLRWKQFCNAFLNKNEIASEFKMLFDWLRDILKELASNCRVDQPAVHSVNSSSSNPFVTPPVHSKKGRRLTPTVVSPVAGIKSLSAMETTAEGDQLMDKKLKSPLKSSSFIQDIPNDSSIAIELEINAKVTEPTKIALFAEIVAFAMKHIFPEDFFTLLKYLIVFANCKSTYDSSVENLNFSPVDLNSIALATFSLLEPIILWLPKETTRRIFQSVDAHNPVVQRFLQALANKVVVSTAVADPFSNSPDNSDFSIPFSVASETRKNLKTPMQIQAYSNQQKIRDEFFSLVRQFIQPSNTSLGSIGKSNSADEFVVATEAFLQKIHDSNITWFATIFLEEYINLCFTQKTCKNQNLAKLQKLEERFSIPTAKFSDLFVKLEEHFSRKEILFLKILDLFDRHSFTNHLLEMLYSKIHNLTTNVLRKKATLSEVFLVYQGISKLCGYFCLEKIGMLYWKERISNFYQFCYENCCISLYFVFFFSFLKISALVVSNLEELEIFSDLNFPSDQTFSGKTRFFVYLISERISKTIIRRDIKEKKLLGLTENYRYKPDLDDLLFTDTLLFSLFPELNTLFDAMENRTTISMVNSIKSPTRKIRPLTEPLAVANEPSNQELFESTQKELRNWFLWKYFKIKELVETISVAVVDNLMEALLHNFQTNTYSSAEHVAAVVTRKQMERGKEIVAPFFDGLLAELYPEQVIKTSIALTLENVERLLAPKVDLFVQSHFSPLNQSQLPT